MPEITSRRFPTMLLAGLIAMSWLALWAWGQSSSARYLDHDLTHLLLGHEQAGAIVFFAAAWTLMTIAMMLPTTLPLVNLFQSMAGNRSSATSLVLLLVAGYLSIWAMFGLLAHFAVAGLQFTVQQVSTFNAHPAGFRTALLLIAGIYQFTPLKEHCLAKCRSPLMFILERWRGKSESIEAFRIGFDHGIYCIGCCWSLMLLMFLVGSASIGWMLALGTVMAIEKNMPWGRRISRPLGALLIAAAIVFLLAEAGVARWA